MSAGAPKTSDNTKYYEILGVSKNTLPDDLKIAYKKAAIQIQGGDPEKFKELAQAYEVLSDPVKRGIYDQYLEDAALKEGGFISKFPPEWKMIGNNLVIPLRVSLEDLYNGATLTVPFPQTVICSKCQGKGSKSGPSMKCSGCRASGTKLRILDFGPPVIQLPLPCDGCGGTGEAIREIINDQDRCEQCKGEKLVEVEGVLQFNIKKGMQEGQMIKFPIEALCARQYPEYGVYFMIQQIVHPKFKRKGDDLFVEHTLSLKEARLGFQFVLAHLDNRQLIIESQPGEVIHPGQVKEINDEGMPMYERPYQRGKLHIGFTVELPDSLTPNQSKLLEAGRLPPRPSPQQTDMEVANDV